MMEVESSFSLDCHVQITKMISTGSQAYESGDEKCVSFNELPAWVAVDDDASEQES